MLLVYFVTGYIDLDIKTKRRTNKRKMGTIRCMHKLTYIQNCINKYTNKLTNDRSPTLNAYLYSVSAWVLLYTRHHISLVHSLYWLGQIDILSRLFEVQPKISRIFTHRCSHSSLTMKSCSKCNKMLMKKEYQAQTDSVA